MEVGSSQWVWSWWEEVVYLLWLTLHLALLTVLHAHKAIPELGMFLGCFSPPGSALTFKLDLCSPLLLQRWAWTPEKVQR